MNARRIVLAALLGGVGLALAVALWRNASAPVRPRPVADREADAGLSTAPPSPQPEADHAVPLASLRTDPPPAKSEPVVPRTPFLQGLAARVESFRGVSDSVEQTTKLESLASEVSTSNLAEAVEFLFERSGSKLYRDAGQRLVRRWAEDNPQAASGWVTEKLKGPDREEAIKSVAAAWANQSLPEAARWLRGLPDPAEQQSGLLAAAYETARTQPMEALKLAVEMPVNEARNDLITHTASQWASTDPQAAAAWAHQISDLDLRARVLASATTAWGDSDPAAAANWAVKSLPAGKHQDDAVVGIVQRWVQKEPEAAAAWVLEFPDGALRNTAIENVVKLWADRDLEQAATWLSGLQAGASRDAAVSAFVGKLAPLFPDVAAQWAEGIGEEAARNQQMESVGESWMATDAAAARAWITKAPLPETARARLLALRKE